jgi:predicted DNA-binding antitoxin AbrB/MazE fold protein
MTITIEATYENGVLKPVEALPLREHQRVRITILPASGWFQQTFGLLGWKGDAELADRFATDPELDYPPPAEAQ